VGMAEPRVSVVVALNHHERPESQVARFAAQTAPRDSFEVVLVDGRPRHDARPDVARALREAGGVAPDLRCLRIGSSGRPAALNAGIDATRGDVVLFLAGDGLAGPEVVERHARFHERDPAVEAAAIGPFLFPEALRADPYRRWLEDSGRLFGVSFTRPDPAALSRFWYVGNASVKRELVLRAGRFDERLDVAGDDDAMGRILFAAGMRVRYLPDAVVEHDHAVGPAERRRLVRQAGQAAAHTYGETLPREWARKVRHSSFTMARRALAARVAAAFLGGDVRRERAWIADAEAAFAAGFRSGRRGELPQPTR
jgi:GT2 family glycosyltransferase